MDEKFKRKHQIILKAVDDFVKTGQPITSASINVHFSDLSSATLRNELNALESMGYFKQVHTSGGRVPTNMAYVEYVNNILESEKLNSKAIKHVVDDYTNKSVSLISTLSSLAKRLSKLTNCPAVLVQHGFKNLVIQNIQIIPLVNKDALLLVETEMGVIDDNLSLDGNVGRKTCNDASEYLTKHFKDKTISYMLDNINDVCLKAGAQIIQFKELIDGVASALCKAIETKCDVANENPTKMLNGLNKWEMDDAKQLFGLLEEKDSMINLLKNEQHIQYTIGDETDGKLKGGMMMSAPILINGVPIASLALVGPKRIDYLTLATALKFMVSQLDGLKGDSDSEKN